MEHVANWVRFADTKATLLTAGLGVVVTMLMTNAGVITSAIEMGCPEAVSVGSLAGGTGVSAAWTLYWLVRAIAPASGITYSGLNRFAWPTLVGSSLDNVVQHVRDTDVDADAWQQALDLSAIARKKFDACGRAVGGFALLVVFGVATVVTAVAVTT